MNGQLFKTALKYTVLTSTLIQEATLLHTLQGETLHALNMHIHFISPESNIVFHMNNDQSG